MPESMDLESDQFLTLLSDALRAGPGSPQWHQAVQLLRADQHASDEYALLCAAREHLESGKGYRAVRPGPGFTRKVFDHIETESPGKAPPVSLANIIAVIAAVVMLAVICIIAWILIPGGGVGHAAVDELVSASYLLNTSTSTTFDGAVPPAWGPIGPLALDSSKGLRPLAADVAHDSYQGCGLVAANSISPDQTFALEVNLRVARATDEVVAQVFVTDNPQFSADRAVSPHELVWLIQNGRTKVVLPDGRVESQGEKIKDLREPVIVRILMNRDVAVVETNGTRLWAGPHQLSASEPRYVGVRFLRRGGDKQEHVVVQSIRIQKP